MTVSDIIAIVCAIINLIAIIIIAVVQYNQGKRMEELSLKQDKGQQIEKAQKIKAQRDSFIMKYYNEDDEIYLLPLCWISAIFDPAHAYHRKMYMEYNMLEEDVQKAICEYMHLSIAKPENEREAFYSECVKALVTAEHRFNVNNHHKSIYYENAKYLRRTFDSYGAKRLPLKLDALERRLTDLLREYKENPRNCPDPLTAFLDEYDFWGCGEHQACELCAVLSKWLAEFSPKEYDENYWVPGEYGFENIATMEDLFLCSLLCVYLFLIMPKKRGTVMSRLNQLIKELCPNGVEYKKLGDIATDIFRGAGITRDQVTEEGTPCVRYGEIYTTYGIYFDTCVSHTDESAIQSKKYFEHGDILFAITGESVEDIAKSTAYVGHEKCLAGGDIVVLKHKQNPKYLSYVLSTTSAQAQKSKGKVKSKVVHSSVPAIKDIVIPVPPVEVQSEIVKILDNFTKLTAELTAELTARKKQYEYYRDLLLDFGVHGGATGECEWRTVALLDMLCQPITDGPHTTPVFVDKGIPFVSVDSVWDGRIHFEKMRGYITEDFDLECCKKYKPQKHDVYMVKSGSTTGKVAYVDTDERFNIWSPLAAMRVNEDNSSRYLYHLLQTKRIQEMVKAKASHGSQPNLGMRELEKFEVTIPPLVEQLRIVSILDRFDKLCNDISEGLPAEIEARQKQYEYYRDKLLSFEEL